MPEQLKEALAARIDSMACGCRPWHTLSKCFQSLASIKLFVFIMATLVTLQQGLSSGYTNSVITTIESRFDMGSRFVGIVVSANDMGNVITVLFVSYLGAKRHIPKWIGTGILVMALGCIIFTLPEFLTANKQSSLMRSNENGSVPGNLALSSVQNDNKICRSAGLENNTKHVDPFGYGCKKGLNGKYEEAKDNIGSGSSIFNNPRIIFIIAQLLIGCGGSPLFTLGITYIDNHVPSKSSSLYIGAVYAMAAFGPVLGFLTGAYFLSVPSGSIGSDGKPYGIWWAGYWIVGSLLFITCLPFLAFPKLKSKKEPEKAVHAISKTGSQTQAAIQAEYEYEEIEVKASKSEIIPIITDFGERERIQVIEDSESIKNIPKFIWRVLSNPTYIITVLGGCLEINIVSGFVVFLSKYMETQFNLGKSQTSLFVGAIAIPGACVGILTGGYLMKRLNLRPSGAAKFVLASNIICLAGHGLFFFLGCPNPNLAGAIIPYSDAGLNESLKLIATCNANCSCENAIGPQMVCHAGTTFYSPCHAGCSENLTQCACASGENVTLGRCMNSPVPCNTLVPFMVLLFFMTAVVAVTQMPLLMMVLRSVTPEDRSFALGIQFVFFRVFGYIPSPIIVGSVIDSSCMIWKVAKCSALLPEEAKGRCLLYDIEDFRYKYVGVLSIVKCCSFAIFLCDYFILRRKEKNENAINATVTRCNEQDNLVDVSLNSGTTGASEKCTNVADLCLHI